MTQKQQQQSPCCGRPDTYIKFCFGLSQSGAVCTIHEEDDAVDGGEVVFPHSAGYKKKNTHTHTHKTQRQASGVLRRSDKHTS